MKQEEFSVLMSLYNKEKAQYFDECMKSIIRQSVKPAEIVIVLDGPISGALKSILKKYKNKYDSWIKLIPLKRNRGLGLALAEGLIQTSYELIARMDTDDIAREDRFEKQLAEFHKNPSLDICGSHIIEFQGNINNKLSERRVPLKQKDIAEYQKQRSAFNHMTVMYKKSTVLRAGNYQHAPLMEDDLMWIHMLQVGAKCMNIDDFLVYARTGYEMIERRGGYEYLKKYISGRKKILDTGYINYWDYWKTVAIQVIVALVPKKVRLLFFIKLLR